MRTARSLPLGGAAIAHETRLPHLLLTLPLQERVRFFAVTDFVICDSPPPGGEKSHLKVLNQPRTNDMKLSLENRVVLITGPAKGMGAAITRAFAAEGCKLALVGRDTAAIAPVASEVTAGGREAIVIPCDLADA